MFNLHKQWGLELLGKTIVGLCVDLSMCCSKQAMLIKMKATKIIHSLMIIVEIAPITISIASFKKQLPHILNILQSKKRFKLCIKYILNKHCFPFLDGNIPISLKENSKEYKIFVETFESPNQGEW